MVCVDQDSNFYLINLSILITCVLDNVWILYEEVICQSLLGVKGLITMSDQDRISPSNIKTISNTQVLENKEKK